ncbi:MAG: dUTP diphosphatase [Desulfuromonadaceae bacterium]|nr:dUTP diphosphatase [Desulfuromonadaceae bacterium]
MRPIDMQVKLLHDSAQLPVYMTELAAGMDLFACLDEPLLLLPGQRFLVPTGIALAIPAGYEGQVRPRSGLAIKKGLTLVNAPGTIDADYRGEVKIVLINHGQDLVTIASGERIAQLVIAPVQRVSLTLVKQLDTTVRDAGGFGHTG